MSTRSIIALQYADGAATSIYVHCDGYPEGVGACLTEHYSTRDKVRALLALGDLSVLYERLAPAPGEAHNFAFGKRAPGVCVAYGRDRGDKDCAAQDCPSELLMRANNLGPGGWIEYVYVFTTAGAWLVYGREEYRLGAPVLDVLASLQQEAA